MLTSVTISSTENEIGITLPSYWTASIQIRPPGCSPVRMAERAGDTASGDYVTIEPGASFTFAAGDEARKNNHRLFFMCPEFIGDDTEVVMEIAGSS